MVTMRMQQPMSSFTRRIKNHFVAFLGEFVGTFLFLFFGFAGAQTANRPSTATADFTGPNLPQLLYVSLIFGFSLAINVWVFFRISGGLFNPAVTLALCITGVVPIVRSLFVFVAQILAGIAAAAVVKGLLPGDEVYFAVHLTSGTSVVQGLFLEMFFTIELVFTILMLAAEKTKATFIAPVGIGLALFVAELVGVYYTGGSLNPARAFGPAIVGSAFDTYHWIYWIGPLLGALVASGFYGIFKFLNYEEVNGDQDKTEEEQEQERKKQRRHPRSSAQRDRDAELGHADSNDVRVENGYGKHDSRASGDGRKGAGAEAVGGSYHLRTDRERERERERRGSSAHTHATLAAVRSGSTAPGHYYTQSSHPQRGERRSAGDGNAIPNPSPRHPQQFRS